MDHVVPTKKTLGGIAARPDRVHDAAFGEAFGVTDRQVLHTPVAVMDEAIEAGSVSATFPHGLLQGVQRQIGFELTAGLLFGSPNGHKLAA